MPDQIVATASGRLDSNRRANAMDKFRFARHLIPTEPAGISLRAWPGAASSTSSADLSEMEIRERIRCSSLGIRPRCEDRQPRLARSAHVRNVIKIESKLRIVTNWNFNSATRSPCQPVLGTGPQQREFASRTNRIPLQLFRPLSRRRSDRRKLRRRCKQAQVR